MTDASYVEFGGASLPPPPYTCNASRFVGHVFRGDKAAQQALVDATLNSAAMSHAAPGRFVALADFVFLLAIASERIGSAADPYARRGTTAECDVGFWIAVGDRDHGDALLLQPVYSFVDNWLTLAGGREIWGFPKALAAIEIGCGPLQDAPIAVSSMAIARFAADASAALRPIFRLDPPATAPAAPTGPHPSLLAALGETMGDLIDGGELILDLVRRWTLSGAGAMVMRRQFRCMATPAGADYCAVTQCRVPITALRGFGAVQGGYRLTLSGYDSHPIARELGLADGVLTSLLGAWADLDFTICAPE